MDQSIVFANDRLVGVLCRASDVGDRPCILILNAGLIYRAGPGRLSVDLARRACQTGFTSFRFDLSGIGDSEPRTESFTSIENAVADAREAMDMLGEQFGFKRFILFGLCSGAVHAHFIAWDDARVVGAIMLDGYIFSTVRSTAIYKLHRVRPLRKLPQRAVGWVRRRLRAAPTSPLAASNTEGAVLPRWPERGPVEEGLKVLKQRGVALLQIFSGEWERYCYEGQLAEALPAVDYGALRTEVHFANAEHLYLIPADRKQLLNRVARWLEEMPWDKTKTDERMTGDN